MKQKGQTPMIGAFIGLMVATIVGVSIVLPVIQDQITSATAIADVSEVNVAALNDSTVTLSDGDILENSLVAVNSTTGETIPSILWY